MDRRPVGMFDSGFGGLSVLREALKLLKNENFIYYGDNANAPYGEKSEEDIERLSLNCADFLLKKGVKAMLVACNTATGTAIRTIRERLSIPVVSIEPAIKPASEGCDGTILMLATSATTRMERYQRLKARMKNPQRIIDVAGHGIVEMIEAGRFGEYDYDDVLDALIGRYKDTNVDAIVLGCTHYLFIKHAIESYAKRFMTGRCELFDGNTATVRQLGRVLTLSGLESDCGEGKVELYSSADMARVLPTFNLLIGR